MMPCQLVRSTLPCQLLMGTFPGYIGTCRDSRLVIRELQELGSCPRVEVLRST
jgi:hypothetical protein